MKKVLLFIIILNSCFLTAQKIGADVIKFSGSVTSTVRDSFDVPTGETWLIWNTTTVQFEQGTDAEVWTPLMGDGTGAVVSVNGKAGTVVINPDDLSDSGTTNKFITSSLLAKLSGIEAGAEMNVPTDWDALSGDARILNKPTLGDMAAKDNVANTDIVGGGLNGQVLTTDGAGVASWENSAGGASFSTITGLARDNTDLNAELDLKQDALTFDSTPTNSSTNPVESNGVYDALNLRLSLLGGTMSGNINMGGYNVQGLLNVTYTGFIDGANELRLTPDNIIGSTTGKNSYSFKTSDIAYLKRVNESIGLGFDFNALTSDKSLIFTDSDITWGGTSLLSVASTDDQTAAEVPFTPNGSIAATDVQAAIQELDTDKAADNAVVKLTGAQTIAGVKTSTDTNHYNANVTINSLFLGGEEGTLERRWWMDTVTTDDLNFKLQQTDQTVFNLGPFDSRYKLNASGTPTDATDLTDKDYVDNVSITTTNITDGTIALADLSATGTASASTYLRGDNTWATVAGGGLASTDIDTSAELSTILTDETGSGAAVFATSPTLVTPALGTPSSGVGTNITGIVSSNVTYDNTISSLVATDVKAAIDEINAIASGLSDNITTNSNSIASVDTRVDSVVTVLATPTNSSFSFDTKTAAYTVVDGDQADGKILLLDYIDEIVTIPSGVFDEGQSIRLQSIASTNAIISPGSGVSFDGLTALVLDSIYKSVTIARIDGLTSPENWLPVDGYIKETALCTADPNETHTQSNAASDPNCNEANATTGWSAAGTGASITTSVDSDTGTYAILGETTGGNVNWIQYTFSITSGDTYDISFRAKDAGGTTYTQITNWTNLTGSPSAVNTGSSYATYSYSVTASATGTATMRFYQASNTGADSTYKIYVDNLSIIKTN